MNKKVIDFVEFIKKKYIIDIAAFWTPPSDFGLLLKIHLWNIVYYDKIFWLNKVRLFCVVVATSSKTLALRLYSSFVIFQVCEQLICPDLRFLRIWHIKAYIPKYSTKAPIQPVHLSFWITKYAKKYEIYKGYEWNSLAVKCTDPYLQVYQDFPLNEN